MIRQILHIDEQLMLWLNGWHNGVADSFMYDFSGRYIWVFMYAAIAATFCWKYGWKRGLIFIAAVAVAVGCSDFLCAGIIRPIIMRMRPANPDNPVSIMVHIVSDYRGGRYGFPSCHASNTFALTVASAIMLRSRPYFWFMLLWAMLQCYSRIYLGVHYPGDIAVGAILGTLMGIAAGYSTRSVLNNAKINKKATVWPAIGVGLATVAWIFVKTFLYP